MGDTSFSETLGAFLRDYELKDFEEVFPEMCHEIEENPEIIEIVGNLFYDCYEAIPYEAQTAVLFLPTNKAGHCIIRSGDQAIYTIPINETKKALESGDEAAIEHAPYHEAASLRLYEMGVIFPHIHADIFAREAIVGCDKKQYQSFLEERTFLE